jgi:hypothetical protein
VFRLLGASHTDDFLPVWRPGRRDEHGASGCDEPSRLLAIGLHNPDFLVGQGLSRPGSAIRQAKVRETSHHQLACEHRLPRLKFATSWAALSARRPPWRSNASRRDTTPRVPQRLLSATEGMSLSAIDLTPVKSGVVRNARYLPSGEMTAPATGSSSGLAASLCGLNGTGRSPRRETTLPAITPISRIAEAARIRYRFEPEGDTGRAGVAAWAPNCAP